MRNSYSIIPAAGSRINGLPMFSSTAEQAHHNSYLEELRVKLGNNFKQYHSSLGFITADLTDSEYEEYTADYRVYSIVKDVIPTIRSSKYNQRDTTEHNQWHLKQLSNRLFSDTYLLCGFTLSLFPRILGILGIESKELSQEIIINSNISKLMHKSKLYMYNTIISNKSYYTGYYRTGASIGIYTPTISTNYWTLDTDIYVGYDHTTEEFRLSDTIESNFIPIYTVKLKLYEDTVTLYHCNNVKQLSFYDLKQLPETADIYQATVQGEGVDIIIADTQLNVYEPDITGRAVIAYNAYAALYTSTYSTWDDSSMVDDHGTACAHIAAGTISGIASMANIVGVTCLDITSDRGDKSTNVLDGLNWIVSYIIAKKAAVYPKPYPIVVSICFGTSTVSAAYDSAIGSMITEGATVCIAAGNDDTKTFNSPYHANAIFIAASNEDLTPCSFTHYGPRVDLYAPGVDIYTTMLGDYSRWAGTSVASPNVAGLCALHLSLYPAATPAEVKNAIIAAAIEPITYNKDDTTYKFVQNPYICYTENQEITTQVFSKPIFNNNYIYTVIPYVVGFDTEHNYGSKHEITVNNLTDTVVSAGKLASVDLAMALRLVV